MSKGKTDSTSSRAFAGEKNTNVGNMVFDSKRLVTPCEGEKRKKPHFYARYMTNKSGYVALTRTPHSITEQMARGLIHKLISQYEEANDLSLVDLSKNVIMCRMLEVIEDCNSIVKLKDEAEQFLSYRFQFLDVVWVYLFKLFYPRIFDCELLNDGEGKQIKFSSQYIEENISTVFKNIEFLTHTIIYDAIIVAIDDYAAKQLSSLAKGSNSDFPILLSDKAADIKEQIETECKVQKDPRFMFLELLIPSIVFLAKYHIHMYDDTHDDKFRKCERCKKNDYEECIYNESTKNIFSILNQQGLYIGSRGDISRDALLRIYKCNRFWEVYKSVPDSITKLLNLYYINKKTHIFDFIIMSNNFEYAPYALNGIITKHHIDKMIKENYDALQRPAFDNLGLSHIYNNPNCIINNITARDYEMIDFLITVTAKTISEYYLKNGESDVAPKQFESFINAINKDGYVGDMLKFIELNEFTDLHKVDYDIVRSFESGGMTGKP